MVIRNQLNISLNKKAALLVVLFIPFILLATIAPLNFSTIYAEGIDTKDSKSLENRAIDLDNQIMCPICPGETLRQSQTTIAKQMRSIIRIKLAEGESTQQIKDYFVSVYGQSILAEPPSEGSGLIAWGLPPIALAFGLIILVISLRSMKGTEVKSDLDSSILENEEQDQLKQFIAVVDRELKSGPDKPT